MIVPRNISLREYEEMLSKLQPDRYYYVKSRMLQCWTILRLAMIHTQPDNVKEKTWATVDNQSTSYYGTTFTCYTFVKTYDEIGPMIPHCDVLEKYDKNQILIDALI